MANHIDLVPKQAYEKVNFVVLHEYEEGFSIKRTGCNILEKDVCTFTKTSVILTWNACTSFQWNVLVVGFVNANV